MLVLTILLLLVLLLLLGIKYRWLALAHPGSWFVAAWITALSSYYLAVKVGAFDVYDAEALDQLYLHVSVSALGFLLACLFIGAKAKALPTTPDDTIRAPGDRGILLGLFAIVSLTASVLDWLLLGPNITDLEARRQAWLTAIPLVTARLWYPYILAYPAALAASWRLAGYFRAGRLVNKSTLAIIVCPLLSGLFWTLGTGGRQALGIVLLYYACGFALGWTCAASRIRALDRKQLIRAGGIILIVVIAFAFLVDLTGRIRADYHNNPPSAYEQYPIIGRIGQFVDYMAVSLPTYQVRLLTLAEGRQLPMGKETFGVLDYINLGPVLGWPSRAPGEELASEIYQASQGVQFAFAYASIYFNLDSDFGIGGGLAFSFALAILSHLIFVLWAAHPERRMILLLAPLVITLMFWGYSHQYSILRYDVLKWMLVSFFAWDLAAGVLARKKAPSRQRAAQQISW